MDAKPIVVCAEIAEKDDANVEPTAQKTPTKSTRVNQGAEYDEAFEKRRRELRTLSMQLSSQQREIEQLKIKNLALKETQISQEARIRLLKEKIAKLEAMI